MSIETIITAIAQASEFATSGDKLLRGAAGILDTIKNKTKGPEPARNDDLRALVVDLASQIADAKLANAMLKMELVELKEAALQQKRIADEFARYELWKTPFGTVIYRLRNEDGKTGEPEHYICPGCKEEGLKSILQGQDHWVECPKCKQGYRITPNEGTSRRKRGVISPGWDSR